MNLMESDEPECMDVYCTTLATSCRFTLLKNLEWKNTV